MRASGLMTAMASLFLSAAASAATLTVETTSGPHRFETAALLAHPAAAEIVITGDVSYGGPPRHYRAVPVAALLDGLPPAKPGATLEVKASDGFASQIPVALLQQAAPDAARAWLAIEPTDAPWPNLPGKQSSAGPFYIVWERAEASRISPEYWPYQSASLQYVAPPAERWPVLTVDAALPANHPARAGQEIFVSVCLACHKMNGAGASDKGPDMNLPMSPIEYFQPNAFRQYLRDPASVRTWSGMTMLGYSPEQLPDSAVDALVAYLTHMAARR